MNIAHRVTAPVLLIVTTDPTGHPVLIQRNADAAPVVLCRCTYSTNRSATIRRRWLREVASAQAIGRDVLAVDATCG